MLQMLSIEKEFVEQEGEKQKQIILSHKFSSPYIKQIDFSYSLKPFRLTLLLRLYFFYTFSPPLILPNAR